MTDELLQSEEWMRFQEAAGRRVVRLCREGWNANGVVHRLPVAGKYLYVPRGPRGGVGTETSEIRNVGLKAVMESLLANAKESGIGWIRIEPETDESLAGIREEVRGKRVVKAPHDMQPRETFVVDLAPGEEELLAAMKPKTRYNIRVAEKRGVKIVVSTDEKYREAFIGLVTGTAGRKGIVPHPKAYYEAMCETLLREDGKIFSAEKGGAVVAANLVVFHGKTATYLHGGSDERFHTDMAPFLLQWAGMCEAKRRGCAWYDFGGVNAEELAAGRGKWLGITRFKFGFSPSTVTTVFPGAYDIVLSPARYGLYRLIQRAKSVASRILGK